MNKRLLSVAIIVLVVGLAVGYGFGYVINVPQIQTLETRVSNLESEKSNLNNTYMILLSNYSWLKQHSFTYYEVGNVINISSLEAAKNDYFDWTVVKGNMTNIGNKPMEQVYVYVILRNPDGTMYFDSYDYEKIEDLYIGETASFDITISSYVEGQTVEIWLVY